MVELSLNQLCEKMEGKILHGSPSLSFYRYNIDSRLTEQGELFFALIGSRNGHDFVSCAAEKGAAGAVVSQEIHPPCKDFALIRVKDTLKALQKLAKKVLSEHKVKVTGITGSIGKTSTKEFAYSLLSLSHKVLKSSGNYNNHIGLPLSILKLSEEHNIAVLEMGMSSPGEIADLTRIAPPDVAVVTNIQPVHLEFFKSIEKITLAKKEILDGMKTNGTAVLNGDDILGKKIALNWKGGKIFFGLSKNCDIRARNIKKNGLNGMSFELIYGKKNSEITIPFFYESALYNFLAAAAVAYTFSVPIEAILTQTKTLNQLSMRGVLFRLKTNINLVDDSYNSNPAALESALKSLAVIPAKRKIAVLGDMLELGPDKIEYHIQAGRQVLKYEFDLLITVGPLSRHMAEGALSSGMSHNKIHSFDNSEETAEEIENLLHEGDLVLVKGSRGMKTEKIVNKLKLKGY